jgi:hypothetical protein
MWTKDGILETLRFYDPGPWADVDRWIEQCR